MLEEEDENDEDEDEDENGTIEVFEGDLFDNGGEEHDFVVNQHNLKQGFRKNIQKGHWT